MFIILHEFVDNLSVITFLEEQKFISLGRGFFSGDWVFFFKAININYENEYVTLWIHFFPQQTKQYHFQKEDCNRITDREKNECWKLLEVIFLFLFFNYGTGFWCYPDVGITLKSYLYSSGFLASALLTSWAG